LLSGFFQESGARGVAFPNSDILHNNPVTIGNGAFGNAFNAVPHVRTLKTPQLYRYAPAGSRYISPGALVNDDRGMQV
jgi:hypothetical protein